MTPCNILKIAWECFYNTSLNNTHPHKTNMYLFQVSDSRRFYTIPTVNDGDNKFQLTWVAAEFSPETKHFGSSRHTIPHFELGLFRPCDTQVLHRERRHRATVCSMSAASCLTNGWLVFRLRSAKGTTRQNLFNSLSPDQSKIHITHSLHFHHYYEIVYLLSLTSIFTV